MDSRKITDSLREIIYPANGKSIVESGMVKSAQENADGSVSVVLEFPRARDPLALSVRKQAAAALAEAFPDKAGRIEVTVREAPEASKRTAAAGTAKIKKVLAVASGKGGVGKSTVTANLAVTLASMGYRVGILDADIYGPSQPGMFGVEGYMPAAETEESVEYMTPASANGIEIMSIGFFIKPSDALAWRGPMATNALRQLIHQTRWGELDYLLIDLPPGTGDVLLSVASELRIDGAVIVTTPQKVATDDVRRGISMFRMQGMDIPVTGIIENMSWFTPSELPDNRYYIFGRGGGRELARETGTPLLGEIPVIRSVMEGSEGGMPAAATDTAAEKYYRNACEAIVHNLG